MDVADFDYDLPPEAIATRPAEPRDAARLCVFDRSTGVVEHRVFAELPQLLRAGDLLVLNDTQVLPWRLCGRRATGGAVECLVLQLRDDVGEGLLKPSKKLRPGMELAMEGGAIRLGLQESLGGGRWRFFVRSAAGETPFEALQRWGRAPLPPYIGRGPDDDPAEDRVRYQTVYARAPGAVAAPTAGLHFTPELLRRLQQRGIELACVTLHVGEGTFAPIAVERVEEHRMHAEHYELPATTAASIEAARTRGGRVIAVGTTSCRTLETCGRADHCVDPGRGTSQLFLYPGVGFRVVDALITNFHLPRSTLLMLVAAFAGRQRVLELYREAIARGYRFYSYGDAMLIL